MDLVIWTYIFGGAAVFGLILAVFSVWNGRMTRREIRQDIEAGDRRAQDLIARMDRRHTELLQRMDSDKQGRTRSSTPTPTMSESRPP